MILLSDEAMAALTGSHKRYVRVSSWLGDELLADDIPVDAGSEESDRSLSVPERVTLTVPAKKQGTLWSPTADDHPLASKGQRLRVELGIGSDSGEIEWSNRGEYIIFESATEGDAVTVDARGLLHLIDEARLITPYQPSGTILSTLRGLVMPALTVDATDAPADRAVPSGINYDEDRLGAVNELLDAWPAAAYVTEDGVLKVVSATQSTTPVLSITDGAGGTVERIAGSDSRDGAFNVVVARGTAADGGQVQGVAYARPPYDVDGAFNPLPVPFFFPSPLLTTVAQAQAAAKTVMERKMRQRSLSFRVDMVPHPAIQLGDVISLTGAGYVNLPCSVEALSLPYREDGGTAELTVRGLEWTG